MQTLVEKICDPKRKEGRWVTRLDVVDAGDAVAADASVSLWRHQ